MRRKVLPKRGRKSVFIVDDHAVVREGLRCLIERNEELEVCGEAGDAVEALAKLKTVTPDLMTIDIAMPGMSGLDLTKKIRAQLPDVRILVLSMHNENLYAERAIRAGANGYMMKADTAAKFMAAINHVLKGQVYVSPEFNEALLQKLGNAGSKPTFAMDALTNRELEVLRLIGLGRGSKQIADELGISIKTVEAHREHIRAKLTINTNSDLVQHAIHWVHSENIPH